jgi:predicted nuclease of restriction endonuclease-like (RecB) superfamily
MKKQPVTPKTPELAPLITELRELIQSARHAVATTVNTLQVLTNFEIGRRIVEHEQKGAERAAYGAELLKELSARLTEEFGKGFSVSNLQLMRKFFVENQERIQQKPSVKLHSSELGQTEAGLTPPAPIIRDISGQSGKSPFTLSWSHYVLLLTIKNPDERSFYETEATNEGWSIPELKRQVASCLYERLALSRDKEGLRQLADEGQVIIKPEDMLKEPYVLEFLGLDDKAGYSESDLETAIIDQLEHFLLELGKGFLFEARQKRFTFDEDHFFVDLVFYNRLLRCYVIIDLKLDKLSHQDLGQMQMYVNYFDRFVKTPDENPTIGILLCKRKKQAIVELTLPADANIHAREYSLYLPSKELLQQKLMDWVREREVVHGAGKHALPMDALL